MRIAIAEDERASAEQLHSDLKRFAQENGQELHVETYPNGAELVDHYRGNWDLILLDVDMPIMDGIEAARIIRQWDPGVLIMFITNLAQYAIKGYEVSAFDYVLKPIGYYALSMKISAAQRLLRRSGEQSLMLSREGDMVRVPLSHLYYIEAFGHQLSYHTLDGDIVMTTARTLTALEEELRSQGFVRCHKGFLINLHYVDMVRTNTVLVAGMELPVGRSRRKALMEALLDFVKGVRPQ